jgi:hypothetical protein
VTCGIFHVDRRDRASLALDRMEAVRPLVDSYVLALLTQRTLEARGFVETSQGACRLGPRLAAELAGTLAAWRHHVAPVVEQTAHALAESAHARLPLLTPLTRTNQRAARGDHASDRRVHTSSPASAGYRLVKLVHEVVEDGVGFRDLACEYPCEPLAGREISGLGGLLNGCKYAP